MDLIIISKKRTKISVLVLKRAQQRAADEGVKSRDEIKLVKEQLPKKALVSCIQYHSQVIDISRPNLELLFFVYGKKWISPISPF